MKIHMSRPWHLVIAFLAVISCVALMRARAQSTPQPASTLPAEPPAQVTPPATVPAPHPIPPAAPIAAPQTAQTTTAARPAPSWGMVVSGGAYYVEKMQRIMFPRVQLNGASVEEVVGLLRTQSREYDNVER